MNKAGVIQPKQELNTIKLEKEFKEKLKLYLIIIRPTDVPTIHPERAVGVLAYRDIDAIRKANEQWGGNGLGTVYHGDYIVIEDLFRLIENKREGNVQMKKEPEEKKTPKTIMPIERFKASLLMAMNEYVKSEKDKKTLARIIKKIDTTPAKELK